MDPQACLERAQNALEEGDLTECSDAVADLCRWRDRGGFLSHAVRGGLATVVDRLSAALGRLCPACNAQEDEIEGNEDSSSFCCRSCGRQWDRGEWS